VKQLARHPYVPLPRSFAALALAIAMLLSGPGSAVVGQAPLVRGALLSAATADASRLTELHGQGYTAILLSLDSDSEEARKADREAAERVSRAGLDLWYWIEVARCPEMANDHPLWMASLQGHPEWRRFFREFPNPRPGEVVKNYPWVPILYQEAFDAHLARVQDLLAGRPMAKGLMLNDLQGAPSACGCGNPVCRWTADYGPVKTATPLGDDAAARFVAGVEGFVGDDVAVVPIWTTECESHDAANEALCAGVGCYRGICWKAYSRQLRHADEQSPTIGALLLYKEFGQDTPAYSQPAGWVGHALHSFQVMPPQRDGTAVEPGRIVAVLQGWDVSPEELAAQREQAEASAAAGWVVAFERIEQSWSPQMVTIP